MRGSEDVRAGIRLLLRLDPRRGRRPAGSHKAGLPGSIPGPGTWRVGRCSAEFHTLGGGGSTPLPAYSRWTLARYANWHSDQAESLMSVGSNPTRAIEKKNAASRGPMATTPLLQRGNGGSTPSGTTRLIDEARWSASALAASFLCKEGDRVRFSGGPCSRRAWAAGPTERRLACNQERRQRGYLRVRLPGGPLFW